MKQELSISQIKQKSISAQIDRQPMENISQLVSRSLMRNSFNKLIFTSKAISMVWPIAYSYLDQYPDRHQSSNIQVLLIDFSQMQVDYLQQTLKSLALMHPKRRLFEKDIVSSLNIVKMSTQTIQKRKILYLKPGILSITSQIFLTDLLRGWNELDGMKIKVIVKLTDKILSYYHYHAWLTTILKIKECQRNGKQNNLSFIYVCNHPQQYGDLNQLSRIYRTFFCKKIVIWPFGRAEIHKALVNFRQRNCFKQWEHTLSMSEGEKKLHQTFMELYFFLKKGLVNKNSLRLTSGDHILYSNIIEEGYIFTKGEFTEFEHVKLLFLQLENSSKLTILNTITKFIQSKDCQIWNSNNSEALGIIESILVQLDSAIFHYENKQNLHNVELIHLFEKYEGDDIEINFDKESQYTCNYPLFLSLVVQPETNQKFSELIKIIESIQDVQVKEEALDENERFEQQVNRRYSRGERKEQYHNVLIMCGTKGIQKFIRESIEGYLSDMPYFHYLKQLYRYLKVTRGFRIKKIKKMYDKRKTKKSDDVQVLKRTGDKNLWIEENKLILKEILFHELQILHEIVLNFELKLGISNEQSQKSMNSDTLFQHNKTEQKLIQSFNQEIFACGFKIIDISQIKSACLATKIRDLIFDTNNTKKRIIIDYENKTIEPNYFYQLLNNCNPSTIIFYSPSPLLLRSLYLYLLEHNIEKLNQLHMLSFENSYETKRASYEVTKEDKAFWSISQARSQLPQFIESPFLRVKNINYRDSIEQAKHQLNFKNLFRNEDGENSISGFLNIETIRRKILVDTRQFKSSLPSYLYHFGFDIVPVFLKTADYVLSDDTAIEKKSIHTKDLHNSIKSFRLQDQLKKMSSSFRHPYLLIECEELSDFVKSNFAFIDGTSGNKGRYQLRKRLMQLLHKYPNVKLIWSTNVAQSCEYIRQLKQGKHDPDLTKFIKQDNEESEHKSLVLPRISQASDKKQQDDISDLLNQK